MRRVSANYYVTRDRRVDTGFGMTDCEDDFLVVVEAFVIQDSGEGCTSELCLVWTPETDATIRRLELDAEELVGCVDAIECAWWANEAAACRLSSARQREWQPEAAE